MPALAPPQRGRVTGIPFSISAETFAHDPVHLFSSLESIQLTFASDDYIADRALALSIKLAHDLQKPLLLEGEAGVGKTDVAKVLDTPLIRLRCYEGLDANTALYEWNYARRILHIRNSEQDHTARAALEKTIFSDEFLLARPLLAALRHPDPRPAVLLIDEVDRADEEFEAFLLEILSEFPITIPELGTIKATHPPLVILTSNRTRELNDALKSGARIGHAGSVAPHRSLFAGVRCEVVKNPGPGFGAPLAVRG